MAWVGSDGSESKEGKDDYPRVSAMSSPALRANVLPTPSLPVNRQFFSAELGEATGQIDLRVQQDSDDYWQQAHNMGIVDSVTSRLGGLTTLILSVASQEEAEQMVNQDPIVRNGNITQISINPLS